MSKWKGITLCSGESVFILRVGLHCACPFSVQFSHVIVATWWLWNMDMRRYHIQRFWLSSESTVVEWFLLHAQALAAVGRLRSWPTAPCAPPAEKQKTSWMLFDVVCVSSKASSFQSIQLPWWIENKLSGQMDWRFCLFCSCALCSCLWCSWKGKKHGHTHTHETVEGNWASRMMKSTYW